MRNGKRHSRTAVALAIALQPEWSALCRGVRGWCRTCGSTQRSHADRGDAAHRRRSKRDRVREAGEPGHGRRSHRRRLRVHQAMQAARRWGRRALAQVAAAGFPFDVLVERHRYDSQIVDDLRRLLHARRPHIIETHHVKSHCLVALSGLWRHYTWVAFHHGYTQTDAKVRAYNQVDRWSLRHATHVVTTNQPFVE